MEVHKDFAKNVICGFARFNGRSTGIIANQPNWLAGVLDCDASRKAARFVDSRRLILDRIKETHQPALLHSPVRNSKRPKVRIGEEIDILHVVIS